MKKYLSFFLLFLTLSSYVFTGGDGEESKIVYNNYGPHRHKATLGESAIYFHQRKTGEKGIVHDSPFHRFIQEDEGTAGLLIRFALEKMKGLPEVVTVLFCWEPECRDGEHSDQPCLHVERLKRFYESPQFHAQIASYSVQEDRRWADEGILKYPGYRVTIDPKTIASASDSEE